MFHFFKEKSIRVFDSNTILAPVSGFVKRLEDVDDAIFANKAMGDGIVIVPDGDTLFAPTDGIIRSISQDGQTAAIEASNGAKYIIHIGICKNKTNDKGFKALVSANSKIQVGDKLVKINPEFLKNGHCSDIIIVVTNSAEFEIDILENAHIKALDPLVKLVKRHSNDEQ